ncbi:MAG: DUF2255 family protein [Candidatus Limnocylindria bacterium]
MTEPGPTPVGFSAADLDSLRTAQEVRIETTRADGAPVHRTVIWVVVDARGRALVRSYRGAGARWYREARAHPDCRLHVAGRVLDVRAVVADDADRIRACSEGFWAKYPSDPATPAMVADAVLSTTLELMPTP